MRRVLTTTLRARRAELGLTQKQLAEACGISRQALNGIEQAGVVPATSVALKLAAALRTTVEALFQIDAPRALDVEVSGTSSRRLVVGEVNGRWVAHPIAEGTAGAAHVAADAIHEKRATDALRDESRLKENLLVAGCAPALGLLAARAAEQAGTRVCWLPMGSETALRTLADGRAHLAGAHLTSSTFGRGNLERAKASAPKEMLRLFHFVTWDAGFVLRPGLKARKVSDVMKPGTRVVRREAGAAAQRLLDAVLAKEKPKGVKLSERVARSHDEVAQAVAWGAADVGVAIAPVARAHGLDFLPLDEERFELLVPASLAETPRVSRLLDLIGSRGFRRELSVIGGYDARRSGTLVETLTP